MYGSLDSGTGVDFSVSGDLVPTVLPHMGVESSSERTSRSVDISCGGCHPLYDADDAVTGGAGLDSSEGSSLAARFRLRRRHQKKKIPRPRPSTAMPTPIPMPAAAPVDILLEEEDEEEAEEEDDDEVVESEVVSVASGEDDPVVLASVAVEDGT